MSFLIRVVLVVFALYLLWRACSRLVRSLGAHGTRPAGPAREQAVDELVQDPVCKLYVARREAVVLSERDGEYFFCSEACRDAFVKRTGSRKG